MKFNADTDVFSGEKKSSLCGEIPVEIELTSLEQLLDQTIGGEWGKASEQGNYKNRIKCIRGTDIPNVSRRVSRMLCKKGNFARMNWQF
ncbi:hypothetical protein [Limosilactobacillus fermentum]|uniref:hypothetical protein n=1 Tax=Limosilactobacillus fermentum TaxID=1613 RepID=UPI003006B518